MRLAKLLLALREVELCGKHHLLQYYGLFGKRGTCIVLKESLINGVSYRQGEISFGLSGLFSSPFPGYLYRGHYKMLT